ncbi:hypothetical protein RND71_043652 [Anisodus tanguticus]|uniref:DNA polymerase alpha catalytic subunit n=1 Tax=Anisodus tanguticus TaxID=243964 RepID=A0AAE1UN27_9SOLA|nr:hypothetical protein RND71_043652 [Anisodus tanguticus]
MPDKNCPTGILPTEIKKLVDSRREVKKLICDMKATPEEKQQLDIKQKALKLTANSMYGCLGFSNSRFYAKPLAAMITAKGREILNNTKQLAESLGFEVIYGDTDSIMINTNSSNFDDARSIGFKLQAEINKQYKLLEIGIDGVFRSILLLKKKKYAAVVATKENNQIKFTKEVKGLDIVRRDWSVIARKVGEQVLDEILSFDKTSEQITDNIHNYLSYIAKEINEKKLTLNNYIISKQLTKNPEDYADKKSLSHVVVALRMNESEKRSRSFKSGDTIPYLICINKEDKAFNQLPSTQRAIHPEELKENPNLEIDAKYYLQQQIHPIVSRLCDPIDGTNANVIAEFLGIESTMSVQQKGADLDFELISRSNETPSIEKKIFNCKELQSNSFSKYVTNRRGILFHKMYK